MLYKDPFYSHVSWMTILKAIIIGWRAHSALSALYTFNLYHNEMGQGQAETCGCFWKANLLPPGKFITRPFSTRTLHSTTIRDSTRHRGSLLRPRRPGLLHLRGERKSPALDGARTREILLPVGLPCEVASSAVAPAIPWIRQRDSEPSIFEGRNAVELHI